MAAAGNPEHRCAARGVGFAPTDEGQKIPFGSFGHTGVATSLVWRGAPTHTPAARSEPLSGCLQVLFPIRICVFKKPVQLVRSFSAPAM